MRLMTILGVSLLLSPAFVRAQQPQPGKDWKDFQFLFGDWTWNGGGQPGQGTGTSTFRPDLGGTVLMRKTHLEYPATKDRAAFAHDDLIYVYHDPQDSSLRGIFFDSDGHVIRYRATVAPDGNSVVFLSEGAPGGTTCRMTYAKTGADSVTEKFEIAPPGRPNDFATYVFFNAKRVGN